MVVFYQPIMDLRTRSVVRGEALCRFPESPPELKNPDDFIQYAERHGLVKGLTEWLLATTLSYWRSLGDLAPPSLSLNLSPQNLNEVDLGERVARALEQHGIHPSRLWLELDERLFRVHDPGAHSTMSQLAKAGVRLSIDGFGPSLSPVSRLEVASVPISELKLDRVMVSGLSDNPETRAKLKAIVDLARDANLELAAKGVEDDVTIEWLENFGFARYQGYVLAPPMSEDEFRDWLVARKPPAAA